SLLNIRNSEYSAAYSLDFLDRTKFYDTFALRDINGRPAASLSYPFSESGPPRNALLRSRPVPRSCWDGMVLFEAAPFLPPLRSVSDSLAEWHAEGSECCLIHYNNPALIKASGWIRMLEWRIERRDGNWFGR
ncbi:cryptococcal mannosyltransferase 1-domain-containing protein, partial [Tuber borchii]